MVFINSKGLSINTLRSLPTPKDLTTDDMIIVTTGVEFSEITIKNITGMITNVLYAMIINVIFLVIAITIQPTAGKSLPSRKDITEPAM
jgi:hypothetical protein